MGDQTLPTKSLIYFSISTFHLNAVLTAWIFIHLNDSGGGKSSIDFSCHLQENAASSELPQERVCTSKVTGIISWDGDFIFNWLERRNCSLIYFGTLSIKFHISSAVLYPESFNRKYVKFLFFFFHRNHKKNHIPLRVFSNNFPM